MNIVSDYIPYQTVVLSTGKKHSFDRQAPGCRPDTLILHDCPLRWFGLVDTAMDQPQTMLTEELSQLMRVVLSWTEEEVTSRIRYDILFVLVGWPFFLFECSIGLLIFLYLLFKQAMAVATMFEKEMRV